MLCGNRKAYTVKKKVTSNWDRARIVVTIEADEAWGAAGIGPGSSPPSKQMKHGMATRCHHWRRLCYRRSSGIQLLGDYGLGQLGFHFT